jgi:hypothetical protein
MCALCAALGRADHWTDAAGRDGFSHDGARITRRAERRRRVALCKRVLAHHGLGVDDLGGSSFIVRDAAGAALEVHRLPEIWSAARRLTGHVCDPLDPALIATLAGDDR